MPVRRVVAHDQVEADRGRVALQRGPIVYAAEWPDNPNGKVRNLVAARHRGADDRVPRRPAERRAGDQGDARSAWRTTRRAASRRRSSRFMAHPVLDVGQPRPRPDDRLARAHRRRARSRRRCRPSRRRARCTTSARSRRTRRRSTTARSRAASNDSAVVLRLVAAAGARPSGSSTRSRSRRRSRRCRSTGSTTPARRGARARVVARALQGRRGSWKPVETHDPFGVRTDRYNDVAFAPVTTSALRLEVTLQPDGRPASRSGRCSSGSQDRADGYGVRNANRRRPSRAIESGRVMSSTAGHSVPRSGSS